MWFKLACAARALGRATEPSSSSSSSSPPGSYRRLERLALERGLSCLPRGVPPNRLLMRAWREMEDRDRGMPSSSSVRDDGVRETAGAAMGGDAMMEDGPTKREEDNDDFPLELVLHLPRYSWATLGRILMRACQEGVSYGRSLPDALHHVWSTNCRFSEDYDFGSPLVDMRISPLLAIPPSVLGRISEYLLESTDIKPLRCTCRAMPSELNSARAKTTEENERDAVASEAGMGAVCPGKPMGKDAFVEELVDGTSTDVPATDTALTSNSGYGQRKVDIPAPRRGRVSKRVRSQMITTEKKAERKTKRNSVQYCLLAGTLSCTAANPDYTKLLKEDFNWEHLPPVKKCMQSLPALSRALTEDNGLDSTGASCAGKNVEPCQVEQICAYLAPSSLHAFLTKWSRHNSGPRNVAEVYLIHISLNTADIFGTEMSESFLSCVMDCFDMMVSTAERYKELTPWYGPDQIDEVESLGIACQFFAVNLLNAELRLKKCESHDITYSQEYQDDSDVLAFMLPNLLVFAQGVSRLEGTSVGTRRQVLELQCRCYWLASSYFLWVGRCSNDASNSTAAEDHGLEYLSKTLKLLLENRQQDDLIVKTPHLESSDRRGKHWSLISAEVLLKYRDQLQSSSIVSRARQCFRDILLGVKERSGYANNEIDHFSEDDKKRLGTLGTELLERYNVNSEKSSEVFDELLSDFLLLHENHINVHDVSASREVRWGKLWTKIASSQATINTSLEGSRPSIIQVLSSSLVVSKEKIPSMFLIYSKLALAALLMRARAFPKESNDGPHVDFEEKNPKEDSGLIVDATKAGHVKRDRLLWLVVNFFTDKMTDIVASNTHESEMKNTLEAYLQQEDLYCFMLASLCVSQHQKDPLEHSTIRIHTLKSVSRLVQSLRDFKGLSRQTREKIESVYFVALVRALIRQRINFSDLISSANDKRLKKWQSHLTNEADLIFCTANEVAELLSLHSSTVNTDGSVNFSHLIRAITRKEDSHPLQPANTSALAQFLEALVWFWNFLTCRFDVSSPTETMLRSRLMVPISSAIISVCGSPGISVEGTSSVDDKSDKSALSFSDYFDSENSVNGLFLPDESSEEEGDQRHRRILLRKICQLSQCVSLVFRSVNEKLICQETRSFLFPSRQYGPFLPLVVTRIGHAMSDMIFQLFSKDAQGEAYPYGARECGNTIDDLLGKAYCRLYGFSFSGVDPDASNKYAPESIKAATHIFRCVRRVYHDNRKSPPNRAFETIELALPPGEESKASKSIKAFLFDAEKKTVVANITTDLPPGFPEWVFSEAQKVTPSDDEHQANISMLRRGVAHELAKGSITLLDPSQKSPSDMDDQVGLSEERELTQSHELSLHKKFSAVLDDLCYNPNNIERWIVLSECLGFKAEYICDRLARIQESYVHSEFFLDINSKRKSRSSLSLDQLQTMQKEEFQESRKNWTPYIGNDLRYYMQFSWSNLSSLQTCAKEIGSTICQIDSESPDLDGSISDCMCWKEIDSMYEERNFVSWANSWAGMFVAALRTMRLRALLIARYLAMKSQEGMHPGEVNEDIGTTLYGELIASTVYGYPMHPMSLHEKRAIAECSNFYFQEAVELSSNSMYTQKCQTIAFELYFMIGKCYEKIASTLKEEMYLDSSKGGCPTRSYERVMKDAILYYSKAFSDAHNAEQYSGGPDKTCVGGSSHGALECLYRLHATRFKVLHAAIRHVKEECDLAELEAFRITSVKWYDKSNESSSTTGVRQKTWDVFADCVDALSHCLREIPLFHRAAYRLAQAYNYGPAFHNPACDLSLGSKQAVPAIKSYRVRGLDTGSCANSASIVISKLFEKKRSQICAVWVTTSAAPSPFEVLNDSLRKYDSLRLKYVRAYVDCMHEGKRKDKIETLLNWATASNQDLPSFYEASAALRGGDPGKHTKQSLLKGSGKGFMTKVKRSATSALAEMILRDLAVMKKNGVDCEGKKKLTNHFKLAYTLFLRLNSSSKEAVDFIKSGKPLAEAQALCKCYLSIQSGYRISSINFDDMDNETYCSILEGAVSKAKAMMQEAKAASKKDGKS